MLVPLDGAGPERAIWHALVPPPVSVSGLQEMAVADTLVFNGASRVTESESPTLGAPIETVVIV
jgi:hypothetical protein